MEKFAEAFVRNPDGSWFCRAPAQFIVPNQNTVTVTPGVTYRRGKLFHGVDIAQWLDDWAERGIRPLNVHFL